MLTIRINSPKEIIWEGEAKSVSSVNSQGPFDILSEHANFITIVQDRDIKVKTEKEELKFHFKNSLIYMHNNLVLIYTL